MKEEITNVTDKLSKLNVKQKQKILGLIPKKHRILDFNYIKREYDVNRNVKRRGTDLELMYKSDDTGTVFRTVVAGGVNGQK